MYCFVLHVLKLYVHITSCIYHSQLFFVFAQYCIFEMYPCWGLYLWFIHFHCSIAFHCMSISSYWSVFLATDIWVGEIESLCLSTRVSQEADAKTGLDVQEMYWRNVGEWCVEGSRQGEPADRDEVWCIGRESGKEGGLSREDFWLVPL